MSTDGRALHILQGNPGGRMGNQIVFNMWSKLGENRVAGGPFGPDVKNDLIYEAGRRVSAAPRWSADVGSV